MSITHGYIVSYRFSDDDGANLSQAKAKIIRHCKLSVNMTTNRTCPNLVKPCTYIVLNESWTNIIETPYKETNESNIVSNQYTLVDYSRFSHSDCGFSTGKTFANKHALF